MGRFNDSERRFATALEMNTRMGAAPWVAHTRHDLALMLLRRGNPTDRERAIDQLHQATETATALGQAALQTRIATVLAGLDEGERDVTTMSAAASGRAATPNVFRREDESWYLAFDGHESRLHDTKGLSYLSALLANPGQEIHALDLASSWGLGSRMAGHTHDELDSTGRADTGAMLDDQAKTAYRQRIEELQETIDEAESWGTTRNAPHRRARRWISWSGNSPPPLDSVVATGGWARTPNGHVST